MSGKEKQEKNVIDISALMSIRATYKFNSHYLMGNARHPIRNKLSFGWCLIQKTEVSIRKVTFEMRNHLKFPLNKLIQLFMNGRNPWLVLSTKVILHYTVFPLSSCMLITDGYERRSRCHFTDLSTLVTDKVHVFCDTCYIIITKIRLASCSRGN